MLEASKMRPKLTASNANQPELRNQKETTDSNETGGSK